MSGIKHIVAWGLLCACFVCFASYQSCGDGDATVVHTHEYQVRHIDGENCLCYGYEETYCTICNFVENRVKDTSLRPHDYNLFWTTDTESTPDAVGVESRHCKWFHLCGSSTDSRPIQEKAEEDLPPREI